jgi:hypothetical protein
MPPCDNGDRPSPSDDEIGLFRQWQLVLSFILCPLRAKDDQLTLKINLTPSEATDLLPTLPGKDQHPDDVAKCVIA